MKLNDRAWIQPGIHRAVQSNASESRRRAQTSHAPQKLGAVGGYVMRFFIGRQKRHAFAKLAIEMIAGEQSIFIGIKFRHDVGLMHVTRCAKHPFGIAGDGDTARTLPQVSQTQLRNFDRRIWRGGHSQVLVESVTLTLKDRIARAVTNHVRGICASRHGRRRPN